MEEANIRLFSMRRNSNTFSYDVEVYARGGSRLVLRQIYWVIYVPLCDDMVNRIFYHIVT